MSASSNALPVVLLFVLFWALEIIATKVSFIAGAKLLPFSVQSSLCAFVVLSIWTIPREWPTIRSLLTSQRKLLAQISFANIIHYGVGSFLYCFGAMLTTATNIAFLVTLSTVFTSIIAVFILNEPIHTVRKLLLTALVIGAYVLTTNLEQFVPHLGDILIIAAAFFWSLGNVLMRKILRDTAITGEVVSLFKPITGIPIFVLLAMSAPALPEPMKSIFSESFFQFEHFGYAAVAGTFAALLWIFLYRALKVAQSAYVSMVGMCTPVLVSIIAITFLDERLSVTQTVGGVIIMLSGTLTHLTARMAETGSIGRGSSTKKR